MKKRKNVLSRILLIAACTATVFLTAGCSKENKITYYIDGKKTDALPEQGLYELTSIRCNKKAANATWDNNTWSLKLDDIGKSVKVDLDFTYTQSMFTMNGMGYETLQAAFDAAGTTPAKVYITKDATGSGTTAMGSDITLYLNGFTLDGNGGDTIVNNGTMTIVGGGGTLNNSGSGEFTKTLVNYGTLTANDVTINNGTTAFSVWNSGNKESTMELNNVTVTRTSSDTIPVINSGIMVLTGCTISGGGDMTHPALLQNDGKASITVNSSTITNTGSGYSLYRESGTATVDASSNVNNAYGLDGEGDSVPAEPVENVEEAPSEQ